MRQYRDRPERVRRDQAEDERLRQALAVGSPAAVALAVARIHEAAALEQPQALLQP